jgi:hypothetical protein
VGGKEGVMTQSLYAHMNNGNNRKNQTNKPEFEKKGTQLETFPFLI